MEKSANNSPTPQYADDVLDGLFISPLENMESFDKMESEEARILAPLTTKQASDSPASTTGDLGEDVSGQKGEETIAQRRAGAPAAASQERVIMRFAGELKSIKQDLLSIKQHFETLKRPQSSSFSSSAAAYPSRAFEPAQNPASQESAAREDSTELLEDLRKLLLYLDRLLESLPEDKIGEFANSEYFNLYRHVFEKLGLS